MGDAPSTDVQAPAADVALSATDALESAAAAPEGAAAVVEAPEFDIDLLSKLHTRVVREARRETWFVVNQSDDDLATIPIQLSHERSIRRVQVNAEVAEFSASPELVLVRPRIALRPGAGTIVVIHFR